MQSIFDNLKAYADDVAHSVSDVAGAATTARAAIHAHIEAASMQVQNTLQALNKAIGESLDALSATATATAEAAREGRTMPRRVEHAVDRDAILNDDQVERIAANFSPRSKKEAA